MKICQHLYGAIFMIAMVSSKFLVVRISMLHSVPDKTVL